MKVGENPLYTIMARHLELVTEVVLEPTSPFIQGSGPDQIKACIDVVILAIAYCPLYQSRTDLSNV